MNCPECKSKNTEIIDQGWDSKNRKKPISINIYQCLTCGVEFTRYGVTARMCVDIEFRDDALALCEGFEALVDERGDEFEVIDE